MSHDPPKPGHHEAHTLRPRLLDADDEKLRRILAVVDDLSDPGVNQALLDPLRSRLASLKPARPPRFARLLFTPLDPLTVPLDDWRAGVPAVPRPILTSIARIVRSGSGTLATAVDTIIGGDHDDAAQMIARAGKMLWPRAAEILAKATVPADWPETGLPSDAFAGLAACIAAVLRRAVPLRRLARDEEIGVAEPDAEVMNDILRDIATESAMSRAMIARLILVRSPHAVPLLRRIVAAGRDQHEKALMRQAIERGNEAALAYMERATAFVDAIGHGALTDVGAKARQATAVLREIEAGGASADDRPRLQAIRAKLDGICRERFTRGVGEGFVARLTAATQPMDGAGQAELETCARDLRRLDASARKVGDAAGYDKQLLQATEAVKSAAVAGTLTPMRHYRLIEILAGSDAAEELLIKASATA
jgi:hypothetical protein